MKPMKVHAVCSDALTDADRKGHLPTLLRIHSMFNETLDTREFFLYLTLIYVG